MQCLEEMRLLFWKKTRQVHEELHVWDKELLKGPTIHIKKMQTELEELHRRPLTDDSIAAQK